MSFLYVFVIKIVLLRRISPRVLFSASTARTIFVCQQTQTVVETKIRWGTFINDGDDMEHFCDFLIAQLKIIAADVKM